ncbi:MAG: bifunctional phosphopantothenoylcysteine decarboxylase/phosphopantothenate--cysteine ligase CoaBC, partial [Rhizobiales bacterium]|nr:bifunctional phosphopantothenoylcysteine decarboxylase/phosphopantothenate--cysteine ligase CoaBC [Hyphomicrobiales bacterium]
ILTRAGAQFVTELSLAHLTRDRVHTDLFDIDKEVEMGHIELSRDADLLMVAPATADLMAKMANGHANDLASTALLATDKPVLIAPAMNVRMWHHKAVQRNLARLKADGVHVVGPGEGEMACGEYGLGRLAEPVEIAEAIAALFGGAQGPLAGMSALVTAGPTHEPIDPVRYIANRSSGKQGYAIASALAAAGARTTLIAGPTALVDPPGITTIHVETANQMLDAASEALPADIAVFAAAVADWRAQQAGEQKIKKGKGGLTSLKLSENQDILANIGGRKHGRPKLVIGFAAETQNVIANAKAKLVAKGADWILANDVSPASGVMGGERNLVHLVTADGVDSWPEMTKIEVASRLVERLAGVLAPVEAK